MQFVDCCFTLWHIFTAVMQYSNIHSWSHVGLRKGSENGFFCNSLQRLSPIVITAFSALQHTLKITCEMLHIFHALSELSCSSISGHELNHTLKSHSKKAAGAVVSQVSWWLTSEPGFLSAHIRDLPSVYTLSNCPHKQFLRCCGGRREGRRESKEKQLSGLPAAFLSKWR